MNGCPAIWGNNEQFSWDHAFQKCLFTYLVPKTAPQRAESELLPDTLLAKRPRYINKRPSSPEEYDLSNNKRSPMSPCAAEHSPQVSCTEPLCQTNADFVSLCLTRKHVGLSILFHAQKFLFQAPQT